MIIPIGDQNRRGAPPAYVNIALVVLNILVFLYELTLSQTGLEELVFRYGVIPQRIVQGEALYTLLTSIFIHGGWLHIIGNLVFLWVFGDNVEAALGHVGYLLFFLGAGAVAGLTHTLFQ